MLQNCSILYLSLEGMERNVVSVTQRSKQQ